MSKPQVTQKQRRKEQLRSGIIIIGLVAATIVIIALTLVHTTSNIVSPGVDEISIPSITPNLIHASVDGLHLGNPNASIKMDVWQDFQCPICKYYTDNIEPEIIKNYIETDKVYYTFHFLPIVERNSNPPTQESHLAANAAMCANEQGHFWEYHNLLFANVQGENVGSFTDVRLVAIAKAVKLNINEFNQCYQSKRFNAQIDQDFAAGLALGAQGTPSIFLDGTQMTPGYLPTYDQIAKAIDTAIAGHP
jgi:protein-disulfide isomerase